jgi:hypothetical protein
LHREWRGVHRKLLRYCCQIFNAPCVATSAARTTENTSPLSLPRRVTMQLPSKWVSWLHSLTLWANPSKYCNLKQDLGPKLALQAKPTGTLPNRKLL